MFKLLTKINSNYHNKQVKYEITMTTPRTGLIADIGNDQNFQRGIFVQGGILVFRPGGIYPPLKKPEVRLLGLFRL